MFWFQSKFISLSLCAAFLFCLTAAADLEVVCEKINVQDPVSCYLPAKGKDGKKNEANNFVFPIVASQKSNVVYVFSFKAQGEMDGLPQALDLNLAIDETKAGAPKKLKVGNCPLCEQSPKDCVKQFVHKGDASDSKLNNLYIVCGTPLLKKAEEFRDCANSKLQVKWVSQAPAPADKKEFWYVVGPECGKDGKSQYLLTDNSTPTAEPQSMAALPTPILFVVAREVEGCPNTIVKLNAYRFVNIFSLNMRMKNEKLSGKAPFKAGSTVLIQSNWLYSLRTFGSGKCSEVPMLELHWPDYGEDLEFSSGNDDQIGQTKVYKDFKTFAKEYHWADPKRVNI